MVQDYKETVSTRPSDEDKEVRGTWNEVEVEDLPIDIVALEAPILEEEPDVSSGVAGALRLAVSKGYLEKDDSNRPSISNMNHLKAQNYSIEDKNYKYDKRYFDFEDNQFFCFAVRKISTAGEKGLTGQPPTLKKKMATSLILSWIILMTMVAFLTPKKLLGKIHSWVSCFVIYIKFQKFQVLVT